MLLSLSVVDCGQPAALEDKVQLSVTGTTYGSVVTYVCDEGFVWKRGGNSSVCGADGLWRGPTLVCEGRLTFKSSVNMLNVVPSGIFKCVAQCDSTWFYYVSVEILFPPPVQTTFQKNVGSFYIYFLTSSSMKLIIFSTFVTNCCYIEGTSLKFNTRNM